MIKKAICTVVFFVFACSCGSSTKTSAPPGKELHISMRGDPKTFDPLQVTEENGELIRYITGGVLVRANRSNGQVEPVLAESWKISDDHRSITLHLRKGLRFSDGLALSARDVERTLRTAFDPKQPSPAGDAFRSPQGFPSLSVPSDLEITVTYSQPKPDLDRLFDGLAIVPPAKNAGPGSLQASAGPFAVAEYKPASYIRMTRNPYFTPPARLASIRAEIEPSRAIEISQFVEGDLHLASNLDPEDFARLKSSNPGAAHDLGPSLGSEFLWFNQAPTAHVPEWKRSWFRSAAFRHAISLAIHREDISRIVFKGYAHPAAGPFSPANKFWFNAALQPRAFDMSAASNYLKSAGFSRRGDVLLDATGHPVEFSVVTNADNKARQGSAAIIQDDLKKIGIRLNIVALEFGSLVDRITSSMNYEACLLGFASPDIDPVQQNNLWLSSGPQHAWWPMQKTPATPWEREIDTLTLAQSGETNRAVRKKAFDRVQQIMYEQEPIIYLVNRDFLTAIASSVQGISPVAVFPQLLWNVERLDLK